MPPFAFALCAMLLAPSVASAQCVLEGSARIGSLRPTGDPIPIEQRVRVSLSGRSATVEGVAPLVFRAVVPAASVRLFIGARGYSDRVVSVSPGASVVVASAQGDHVVAYVSADAELTLPSVRLPCAALSTTVASAPRAAAAPEHPPHRGWISRATAQPDWGCVRDRRGGTGCGPRRASASRCQPIGDGSECGFHPVRRSLRIFAAPSARRAAVIVQVTRDVVFIDEGGRRGWLLVASHGHSVGAIALRGWVRTGDVRWAQEVPPSVSSVGLGRIGAIGRMVHRDSRLGWVTLDVGEPLIDDAGVELARVGAEGWCASAEQRRGAADVLLSLPGQSASDARLRVSAARARWIDACTTPPRP